MGLNLIGKTAEMFAEEKSARDAERKAKLDAKCEDLSRAQEIAVSMGWDAFNVCLGRDPNNYRLSDVARWFHLCAERRGLGASQIVNNEGSIAVLPDSQDHAVVLDGRFAGWLLWRHPDGQWVTIKKLDIEQPDRV